VSAHGCHVGSIFIASCLNTYYDFNVGTLYGYRYHLAGGSYLQRNNGKAFRTASYSTPGLQFTARNFMITTDGYYSYGSYDGIAEKEAGVGVRCVKD
jgi:hypothetical protein